jgi:hypothetical protein
MGYLPQASEVIINTLTINTGFFHVIDTLVDWSIARPRISSARYVEMIDVKMIMNFLKLD